MLIYHIHSNACSINGREYKSSGKRNHSVNQTKVLRDISRKSSRNKKLSKTNKKFLEGLGLKVKQSIENC